jgi:hypothetical protein
LRDSSQHPKILTDRKMSLAAEKLNRLLFLKKNLRTLQQINEDKSKGKTEQFKRKLSISNDESVSIIKDRSNYHFMNKLSVFFW